MASSGSEPGSFDLRMNCAVTMSVYQVISWPCCIIEHVLLMSVDIASMARSFQENRPRSGNNPCAGGHVDLHDQPSSWDQASHSTRLLQNQLHRTHINEMAAANSEPAGSWLMPGISKALEPNVSASAAELVDDIHGRHVYIYLYIYMILKLSRNYGRERKEGTKPCTTSRLGGGGRRGEFLRYMNMEKHPNQTHPSLEHPHIHCTSMPLISCSASTFSLLSL